MSEEQEERSDEDDRLVIMIDGKGRDVIEMIQLCLSHGIQPPMVNQMKRMLRQHGHDVQVVPLRDANLCETGCEERVARHLKPVL